MAKGDHEDLRAQRARALRQRVDDIVARRTPAAGKTETPRDFVHRRMREIAAERGKAKPGQQPRRT